MSVNKLVSVLIVAVYACLFGFGSLAAAVNVAWVSFHPGDNQPSAGAATLGGLPAFTTAPDKGYTDLLKANGHNVVRVVTTGNPDLEALNKFDLVIISRSVPSGDYETDPETRAWNTGVYKPMMVLGGYPLRNSRMGWVDGTTIPDTAGAIKLTVTDPAHPIFSGIALDGTNTMVSDYTTGLVTLPFQQNGVNTVQRGISVNTNAVVGGGNLLATVGTAGDPAVGGMVIAEWESGAQMATAPADFLGGHRIAFLTGSREHDGTAPNPPSSDNISGVMDLTSVGQQMFLNAVTRAVNSGDFPADFNSDQAVNQLDYQILRDNFQTVGVGNPQGDANFDGTVNFADFRIWKNTQTGAGSAAGFEAELLASIPEPGSLILLVMGAALTSAVRRRR